MIERIQALIEKATPGPWRVDPDSWDLVVMGPSPDSGYAVSYGFDATYDIPEAQTDAAFIAHARQLLPLMLDVAEASRTLFGFGLDDPPNSVIFDPHGAIDELGTLASRLAGLESYCAEHLPESPA